MSFFVDNSPFGPALRYNSVFIGYFTCYTSPDGELQYYKDVYGYDAAIWKEMKKYLL